MPGKRKSKKKVGDGDPFGGDQDKAWQCSDAKAALKAAIMGGEVPLEPAGDEDEDVLWVFFNSRAEIFNCGGFDDHFKRRLASLRKDIQRDNSRADEDLIAFNTFTKNHPKATVAAAGNYPEWEGSDAQKWLKDDMAHGKHHDLLPMKLWDSRDDYILFPLKVFRDHIYQETRTAKYLNNLKKNNYGERWKDHLQKDRDWCSTEGYSVEEDAS